MSVRLIGPVRTVLPGAVAQLLTALDCRSMAMVELVDRQ